MRLFAIWNTLVLLVSLLFVIFWCYLLGLIALFVITSWQTAPQAERVKYDLHVICVNSSCQNCSIRFFSRGQTRSTSLHCGLFLPIRPYHQFLSKLNIWYFAIINVLCMFLWILAVEQILNQFHLWCIIYNMKSLPCHHYYSLFQGLFHNTWLTFITKKQFFGLIIQPIQL